MHIKRHQLGLLGLNERIDGVHEASELLGVFLRVVRPQSRNLLWFLPGRRTGTTPSPLRNDPLLTGRQLGVIARHHHSAQALSASWPTQTHRLGLWLTQVLLFFLAPSGHGIAPTVELATALPEVQCYCMSQIFSPPLMRPRSWRLEGARLAREAAGQRSATTTIERWSPFQDPGDEKLGTIVLSRVARSVSDSLDRRVDLAACLFCGSGSAPSIISRQTARIT